MYVFHFSVLISLDVYSAASSLTEERPHNALFDKSFVVPCTDTRRFFSDSEIMHRYELADHTCASTMLRPYSSDSEVGTVRTRFKENVSSGGDLICSKYIKINTKKPDKKSKPSMLKKLVKKKTQETKKEEVVCDMCSRTVGDIKNALFFNVFRKKMTGEDRYLEEAQGQVRELMHRAVRKEGFFCDRIRFNIVHYQGVIDENKNEQSYVLLADRGVELANNLSRRVEIESHELYNTIEYILGISGEIYSTYAKEDPDSLDGLKTVEEDITKFRSQRIDRLKKFKRVIDAQCFSDLIKELEAKEYKPPIEEN